MTPALSRQGDTGLTCVEAQVMVGGKHHTQRSKPALYGGCSLITNYKYTQWFRKLPKDFLEKCLIIPKLTEKFLTNYNDLREKPCNSMPLYLWFSLTRTRYKQTGVTVETVDIRCTLHSWLWQVQTFVTQSPNKHNTRPNLMSPRVTGIIAWLWKMKPVLNSQWHLHLQLSALGKHLTYCLHSNGNICSQLQPQ